MSPTLRTVQGRVLDALHGTPVPRALVHLNARAMLTDAQGRFSFAQFGDAQAYASVIKPGYSSGAASDGPSMTKVPDLDASLELKLYPDALLTGTVTARNGPALAGVGVQLFRANYDASGISAVQVRYTVTDSRGNYRFQEPSGKYRIVSQYINAMPETGEAVLATAFPGGSTSGNSGYFALASGEEKRINLRPATGTAVPVELKVDGIDGEDGPGRMRLSVEAEGGVPFSTQAQAERTPGLYRITLPAGSYTLQATAGSRDEPLEGRARTTVSAHGTNSVLLHLAGPATFPVEIALDGSVQTASGQTTPIEPPNASQLNLSLHSLNRPSDGTGDLRLYLGHDGVYAFSVPAGEYRLVSSGAGAWTISSALLGTTSLADGEIHVAGGAGGTPIRLLVGNATGQVAGTIAMGDAPSVWLYLIAREPSLTPFYLERVGATGTFSRNVPPGSYLALAVENRLQEDLHDRVVVDTLASRAKEVTVAAGGKASVDLVLQADSGAAR